MTLRVCLSMALLLSAIAPSMARADGVAAAEALFRDGLRLMKAKRYKQACRKLEESQRTAPGTGTLWHLARCYEATGKYASAWSNYLQVAQETRINKEFDKMRAASQAAERLEPRLQRLAIDVPKRHRVDGLVIERNGVRLGPGGWGTALPIDRGPHRITASAPGYRPWKTRLRIGKNPLTRLRVPLLAQLPPGYDIDQGPGPNWAAWSVVGASAVSLGFGAFSFIHAENLDDEAQQFGLIEERLDKRRRARNFRIAGWVAVAAGLAGSGVSVYLFTRDRGREKRRKRKTSWDVDVRSNRIVLGINRAF